MAIGSFEVDKTISHENYYSFMRRACCGLRNGTRPINPMAKNNRRQRFPIIGYTKLKFRTFLVT